MRRSLVNLQNPTLPYRQTLIPASAYSTSGGAGGGGGGGRGRGRGSSSFPPTSHFTPRTPGKTESDDPNTDESPESNFSAGIGRGHGRGKPLPSTPILPSFSSFVSNVRGTGRGRVTSPQQSDPRPPEPEQSGPKKPIFFRREDASDSTPKAPIRDLGRNPEESDLPSGILSVLADAGAGRGKPEKPADSGEKVKVENRHLRARPPGQGPTRERGASVATEKTSDLPKLSREEAVKKAMGILSKGGGGDNRGEEGGRGRGSGGRGSRGGRGRGRGFRDRGDRRSRARDEEEMIIDDDDVDDGADEILAKRIGPENMSKLVEDFEELSYTVLPSPADDAYLDAMNTNYMIECEPEYLMEEFGTNPNIDEKPPIPLRDALEKMKPFLMAYEGIQSQEEWEEAIKETMEKVPIIKEIVDHYSGPDRVTAKRQEEELERVAKTLPERAPASVKRFTDRAVLSLKSNPGWGFDKKCQFMDKLVWEVSQHYK
ncbi:replication factor C subunit 1 [Cornus florida]|uniref:replication factor C subunit 1 n=1 Tax=Cornus florida TaxID=4283 RepID=UPI002897F262|nr:replication factor C subunit 1 [Cornus florida]